MFTSAVILSLLASVSAWTYPSPGCSNGAGFKLDSTGRVNRTLPSGRTYLFHLPGAYNASNGAHPLVLSFHGAGGTSANQERLSQFSQDGLLINELPIIAAYPQGANNAAENRTGVWYSAPYYNKTVDDVQFAKDIVTDIQNAYCVDRIRIYASGKSNGGGFTAYLACRPDTSVLFAAFAPVSPALYPESLAFKGCNPARAVPIINAHGVLDTTIPFAGRNDTNGTYGVGVATINVPLWRRQWAIRNGCKTDVPAVQTNPYPNTTEMIWRCNTTFQAYTVSNLGHSWPTTGALDASGAPNNTASFNLTSPAMITFFDVNPLPFQYIPGYKA
ncbi:Alpha/Beta hydrolase protein [Dioszegia hungarica]|uniref:feruloyl esterase n=1 Tax=Dioszegia hungarica TaxID=4972 RepID=A0AA38H9L5_9TREE|nr:Alpha/Beta hydrolase protein [Dioszegia hungarica]KAI9636348.1 Alpha/Beta hydrolase protein [Dioszegia hungarica]